MGTERSRRTSSYHNAIIGYASSHLLNGLIMMMMIMMMSAYKIACQTQRTRQGSARTNGQIRARKEGNQHHTIPVRILWYSPMPCLCRWLIGQIGSQACEARRSRCRRAKEGQTAQDWSVGQVQHATWLCINSACNTTCIITMAALMAVVVDYLFLSPSMVPYAPPANDI